MTLTNDQIIEKLRSAANSVLKNKEASLIISIEKTGNNVRANEKLSSTLKDALGGESERFIIRFEKSLDENSLTGQPLLPWVKDMNQQYQKVMSTIISLSTASLILPIFFLRNLLNIPAKEPLVQYLSNPKFMGIGLSYWSWGFLGLSILCSLIYFYVSANRLKEAWGVKVQRLFWKKFNGENTLKFWLYLFFNISVLFFIVGVVLFICFAVFNYVK
jgi:hypothetical protein